MQPEWLLSVILFQTSSKPKTATTIGRVFIVVVPVLVTSVYAITKTSLLRYPLPITLVLYPTPEDLEPLPLLAPAPLPLFQVPNKADPASIAAVATKQAAQAAKINMTIGT